MKNCYYLKYFILLIIVGITFSCSDDDGIKIKKEYLITQISTVDETLSDYNGVSNIWEYKYDENQKLISVIQYNPRNISNKIENKLIYNSNNELIKIQIIQDAPQHQDEYLITHEEGKVSLYDLGADIKNYYYNSNNIIRLSSN